MQTFTTTKLKNEMASVYNAVAQDGQARIEHRDRPPMVIIDQAKLESLINFAKQKGYKIA